nr:four-carbon acid sugar kinase family protein [uncultured Cohaesibacter sp.]
MKEDQKLAIIADDFTGAGDSGVHFSRLGKQIKLLLHRQSLSDAHLVAGNISINSETRFLPPEAAARLVTDVIGLCRSKGYERFYKKIDSTMRGNPGAETEAALAATGKAAALICTAMPETGRTCRDGQIYLFGTPLHQTDIGQDPFHPLARSDIAGMIGEQTALATCVITIDQIEAGEAALDQIIADHISAGIRLIIADATCEAHLSSLARAALQSDCLPVGAGGFARALALVLAGEAKGVPIASSKAPEGPLLAIVGSLARPSLIQADRAEERGDYLSVILPPDARVDELAALCHSQLADRDTKGGDILLRMDNSSVAPRISNEEGARIAALVGAAAFILCRDYHCQTVFSTGGETAIAVANALGIPAIDLADELMPGVVLGACQAGELDVKWFISKAGGFGNEEVLLDIQSHIRNHHQ